MHLMADRSTHMRYLESQLGRMQVCCDKVHGLGSDVEDLRRGMIIMQDKVVNLAKLLDHERRSVDDAVQQCKTSVQELVSKQQVVHDLLFGQGTEVLGS